MDKTIKLKFVGKWEGLRPEDNLIVYWLKKSGVEVEISEEPDYVICDVFGNPPYEYCKYPQIRIFECGENYVPDFNLMDYAVSRYPITYGDRNFYYPGCTNPGEHWHALGKKDRSSWGMEKLQEKTCFANLITSHDSEHQLRSTMFHKLSAYKRVESAGSLLNNMPGGQTVDWLDDSKIALQKSASSPSALKAPITTGSSPRRSPMRSMPTRSPSTSAAPTSPTFLTGMPSSMSGTIPAWMRWWSG